MPTILKDKSRVLVVGCGPAGSLFAIKLLREAKETRKTLSITLIDSRVIQEPFSNEWTLKGCNFCAGVISPRLYNALAKNSLKPPQEVVNTEFSHIWIHGLWKNFPLKVPSFQKVCSVFRGILPPDRPPWDKGFDNFLLKKALEQGASVITGSVETIQYSCTRKPILTVNSLSGKKISIESDFVCIATGMNAPAEKNRRQSRFIRSYKTLNPSFVPPGVRPTLVFELKPGRAYLKKHMNKELYLIVSGSKNLHLDHIVLVPKHEYLSVALTGKSIDSASLPEDTDRIIRQFLSLPHVRGILPHITPDNTPIVCSCCPKMVISPSLSPFEDRISMVGDAMGARLYRDGLYSAFISAQCLAQTIIHKGIDKKSLEHGNKKVIQWLKKDNQYGKVLFTLIQAILKSDILSRILYQTFATEMKFKQMTQWPMGNVLWKIGSGSADYTKIFREIMSMPVFYSILTGGIKTLRNILTEMFFGLNWETYGRYPTVILKEKRNYIKQSISAPLGITLDTAPQMERMYTIKIRASSRAIFEELGKFGDADAKFLKLRFVDVKRISGVPNKVGSIVRYKLNALPVSMDVCLVRCIPNKSLLYDPQELFTSHGRLLFDITPTNDGNNRLTIYTAFNFKKGNRMISRIFWKLFKHTFPDYAHDVVWNHAICCIKARAEQNTY
ncbi:NAD(P)/FAD-dependent oxidoreductase [Desulfobacula toluolica]|uniref:Uncharacterized protein n=1 Tax=Desulfobacula toluolica (strain DSM 7467 / Tol2) TaxID=651182 RepID=K0NJN7_DESTT|nr:hypothetical protein [Desulfobacula toluolica]CCK80083.1 uncharacterized protein TOL2_C19220 [Desulfobacula toluolica Tol2]